MPFDNGERKTTERAGVNFREHELDRPIIQFENADGTLFTSSEPVAEAVMPEKSRMKPKKSIRMVAEEHKKQDELTSRDNPTSDLYNLNQSLRPKRRVKMWSSKLVEVTTEQARMPFSTISESHSRGPITFKWVRGELIDTTGTYGSVYLALNVTTGEMISVKQVESTQTAGDKKDSRQDTILQALKSESEKLKDLHHPNIMQYLGFEETLSVFSIFFEYVPGGSIENSLRRCGKFEDMVTRSFTAQILSGLEYLHSNEILHLDLKADNILLEATGICKISEFGIFNSMGELSGGAFSELQQKVFWMAPEVANTQNTEGYSLKTDIWSVGCVVLEMWTGMKPWIGEEMVTVMSKLYHSKLPPPIPEGIVLSDHADDFRRKCFAINPEDRPQASELKKHPYLALPPDWEFTGFISA